jgi:hypothetical protein
MAGFLKTRDERTTGQSPKPFTASATFARPADPIWTATFAPKS